MGLVSRAERVEIWQQRVDRYLVSHQTVTEFCKTEGVSSASLYQWKRRLATARRGSPASGQNTRGDRKNRGSQSVFTELVVTGSQAAAQAQLPNGVSISLGRDAMIAATIVDRLLAYEPAIATSGARSARRSSCSR